MLSFRLLLLAFYFQRHPILRSECPGFKRLYYSLLDFVLPYLHILTFYSYWGSEKYRCHKFLIFRLPRYYYCRSVDGSMILPYFKKWHLPPKLFRLQELYELYRPSSFTVTLVLNFFRYPYFLFFPSSSLFLERLLIRLINTFKYYFLCPPLLLGEFPNFHHYLRPLPRRPKKRLFHYLFNPPLRCPSVKNLGLPSKGLVQGLGLRFLRYLRNFFRQNLLFRLKPY